MDITKFLKTNGAAAPFIGHFFFEKQKIPSVKV